MRERERERGLIIRYFHVISSEASCSEGAEEDMEQCHMCEVGPEPLRPVAQQGCLHVLLLTVGPHKLGHGEAS